MVSLSPTTHRRSQLGLAYARSGFFVMWAAWVAFVIFLCEPRRLLIAWPLPTVDGMATVEPWLAALIDVGLVALFGLQHSIMARPWFKQHAMRGMPEPFKRATYVHMANLALLTLVLFWQPMPAMLWDVGDGMAEHLVWGLFAAGWLVLFAGAWSFGIRDLLGLEQMQAWVEHRPVRAPRLKTGQLYQWLRHPMYVGVLLGVWATPRMSVGHAILALAMSGYVMIGMRYEERDLETAFGTRYRRWRDAHS